MRKILKMPPGTKHTHTHTAAGVLPSQSTCGTGSPPSAQCPDPDPREMFLRHTLPVTQPPLINATNAALTGSAVSDAVKNAVKFLRNEFYRVQTPGEVGDFNIKIKHSNYTRSNREGAVFSLRGQSRPRPV